MTRIPLPMPADGLRAVNVYVIEDGERLFVIDSGWAVPVTAVELSSALARMGRVPEEISHFAITHAHHDHYTHALELRSRLGCHVMLGRGERHSITQYAVDGAAAHVDSLVRAGAGDVAARYRRLKRREEREDTAPWGQPDAWLDHGEELAVGDDVVEVFATPGHTRGHVVFRNSDAGLLFSGDHVLPHITPSIGYEAAPEPFPLRSYLQSLQLVRDLPDTLLLPAHGPVRRSTHHRVDELLAHHEERFARIVTRVRAGDSTAHQVAAALPWTRRERRLADLDLTNQALAVMETQAHLDVLASEGVVVVDDVAGTDRYSVKGQNPS